MKRERIPQPVIDQILAAADLLEVVQEQLPLKRLGKNYWACCPFHHEKSPSFSVAPDKGIYKCFGCGKSGNVVSFVMEFERLAYPQALRQLARKYGIAMPEDAAAGDDEATQQRYRDREAQLIVTAWARDYFRDRLASEEGQAVGAGYLRERGLLGHTLQTFEVGYAPEQWDGLLRAAEQAGHTLKYLDEAGLVVRRQAEPGQAGDRRYDRFRGRVMFPIHNLSGRVVGFGGRALKPGEKAAKYVNSPESDIYHKSEQLYGLFQARQSIRQLGLCYLVEGYLDVLSLHQGGLKNVVSTSGTSLTEGQVQVLRRHTEHVTLLYDGDAAGIRASLRGVDVLLDGGLNVRVVLFPDDHDPDSYIRQVGDVAFAAYVAEHSQDFIAFHAALLAREASADPVRKAEAVREILLSITRVPDGLKRQMFMRQTAEAFDLGEALLWGEYHQLVQADRAAGPLEQPLLPAPDPLDACERAVLRLLVLYGGQELNEGLTVAMYLASAIEEPPQTLLCAELWRRCRAALEQGQVPDVSRLVQQAPPALAALLADFAAERYELSPNWGSHAIYVPTEAGQLEMACKNAVLRLQKVRVQRERQGCLAQLKDEQLPDDDKLAALVRFQSLTKLDNQLAQMLGTVVAQAA